MQNVLTLTPAEFNGLLDRVLTPTQRRNHLLGIFYYETADARERRAAKAIEDALGALRRKNGKGGEAELASRLHGGRLRAGDSSRNTKGIGAAKSLARPHGVIILTTIDRVLGFQKG